MPKTTLTVDSLTHPDYLARLNDWQKWRYTYEGGRPFIDKYLKRFSNREDYQDWLDRKSITYCPAFAKAGINEVNDSIYQRMVDITRVGGSQAYNNAMLGLENGVDLQGNSMNSFIGQEVLPEMLMMGKVGVYVDMPVLQGQSLAHTKGKRPYIYLYKIEDIRNWVLDDKSEDQFQSILLRDHSFVFDEETGFPISIEDRYRHLWKQDGVVWVQMYNSVGNKMEDPVILNIPKIPFVLFELSDSLLTDIADYQIALMNLASSDIAFTLKANFPFYVEQYDARAEGSPYIRGFEGEPEYDDDGNEVSAGEGERADEAQEKSIKVGASTGRRYPKDLDAPAFIHPSSEPMKASMEKQEQLKREIRLLLNLGLSNVKTVGMQSAESKKEDNRGLEAGLSNIGMTLEKGEREIAHIWSMYEGNKTPGTVKYPVNYSLRSEDDRRAEAKDLESLMSSIPSGTYQEEIGKQITRVMLGHYVSPETLAKIDDEIMAAPNMVADPAIVAQDVENGLVCPETASMLRGYPEDEAKKAEEAHAKRLARIAAAQSNVPTDAVDGARGVPDADGDPKKTGKVEKEESRDTDQDDVVSDKTRGEGK